jgi:hypothetical protein
VGAAPVTMMSSTSTVEFVTVSSIETPGLA